MAEDSRTRKIICRYLDPDGNRCTGEALNGQADVILCYTHTLRAVRSLDITRAALDRLMPPTEPTTLRPGIAMSLERGLVGGPNVVYYIRRDRLIKIGTSANIVKRMRDLNPHEILAFEPGGSDVERQRHAAFRRHRKSGEWFVAASELVEYIAQVRRVHGAPSLADPKWTGRRTEPPVELPGHVIATLPAEIRAAAARLS